MTSPIPPCLDMLSWHVFHVPMEVTYAQRKNSFGMPIPGSRTVYNPKPGFHEWMKEHLKGKWSWGEGGSSIRPYYIQDKGDAMLFKLTWFEETVKLVFR